MKNTWLGALRTTLRQQRVIVAGSVELLIEAMRIADASTRRRLISAVVDSVDARLPPIGRRHAYELIQEIRRTHPDWLAATVDLKEVNAAAARSKALWRVLLKDPEYVPAGMVRNAELLHAALGSARAGQKRRRALAPSQANQAEVLDMLGDAQSILAPTVQALEAAEQHWRIVGGALWWDALRGDPQLADMKTWLSGYLRPVAELDRGEWMAFWCEEVSAAAVPIHVAEMMAEFHQIDPGVALRTSNAIDVLHTPYLIGLDLAITADLSFAQVLTSVRAYVPGLAQVATFDWASSNPGPDLRKAVVSSGVAMA